MFERDRQSSFDQMHNNKRITLSPKRYLHNEDLLTSKIIKELRIAYAHTGLSTETDAANYLQFIMILQYLNYINKQKATDNENSLLVEAWNSLKTKTLLKDNN